MVVCYNGDRAHTKGCIQYAWDHRCQELGLDCWARNLLPKCLWAVCDLPVPWFWDVCPTLSRYLLVLHSKSVSLRQLWPICLCTVLERPLRIQRWLSSVVSLDTQVVSAARPPLLVTWWKAHRLPSPPNLGHTVHPPLSVPATICPGSNHCSLSLLSGFLYYKSFFLL